MKRMSTLTVIDSSSNKDENAHIHVAALTYT